jgi:hypothetical protein
VSRIRLAGKEFKDSRLAEQDGPVEVCSAFELNLLGALGGMLTRFLLISPFRARLFSVRSVVRNEIWQEGIKNRVKELSDTAGLQSRANQIISRATAHFSDFGSKLNHLTGYDEIESLKRSVYSRGVLILTHL